MIREVVVKWHCAVYFTFLMEGRRGEWWVAIMIQAVLISLCKDYLTLYDALACPGV